MSLNNFSTVNSVVTVNGRVINDWGENATPYTDEPIDPASALRRGQGGNAVRLDRINPGRRVTLYLNPGSPDSAYLQGLLNSNANIELTFTQIGTLDAAVGVEGVIVNDATRGRAGTTISDDQFILEFNNWTGTRG
ncbi:putative tail tube protein [Phage vB_KsaM-C1]|nr:putative tail tube protein [Phage vB_KsaM-C1]